MLQSVRFHRLVVEPGTVTGLPFVATYHAELCSASARHMVASFFQLDHSRTVEAALPPFFLSNFGESIGLGILGTFSRSVHFVVTYAAYACPTFFAFSYFATILHVDMIRFDPLATMARRAVDTVSGRIFMELPVPDLFELLVEELVDILERNVLRSATFGWHVGRVADRHRKDAAQATMAHPVRTGKFRCLDDWYVVRAASETGHLFETRLRSRRTSKKV